MATRSYSTRFRRLRSNINLIVIVLAFLAAALFPLVNRPYVHAAQLTNRSATISTSAPGSSGVQIVFGYTLPNTAATKKGIIYQFCTQPLGTCSATGWTLTGFSHVSQSGWPDNGTDAFAAHAASDENDCTQSTDSTTMICFERSATTAVTGGAVTHTIGGITTNSTIQTVYIRISTYSADTFTNGSLLDTGVVAVSVNRQLTVSGRVQERLAFCVFSIGSATTDPANCGAAPTTTTVDIGVIDNSTVAVSPVPNSPPSTFGNDMYGALQVNTNAQNGVSVTYFAEAAGTGTNQLRSFRVSGATCNATASNTTDQCFVSADNSTGKVLIAANGEGFGMYVACIDSTVSSVVGVGLDRATIPTQYKGSDNDAASSASCQTENSPTPQLFAWNDTSSPQLLASSSSVVDNEIIKLRFGAIASATTPTGQYAVTSTYIATPTF